MVTEEQIRDKIDELAKQVAADYADIDSVLLVGVLKGAFMFMADFARALGRQSRPVELEFMAVSSYGQRATSSGVVRILKDLDRDIASRHVIVVEDIVDSGLTLSWLLKYLESRSAASVEVVALLRKPDAVKVECRSGTSASTSPTSSWSATGWTSPSATARCPTSACFDPRSTPGRDRLAPGRSGPCITAGLLRVRWDRARQMADATGSAGTHGVPSNDRVPRRRPGRAGRSRRRRAPWRGCSGLDREGWAQSARNSMERTRGIFRRPVVWIILVIIGAIALSSFFTGGQEYTKVDTSVALAAAPQRRRQEGVARGPGAEPRSST